MVRGYLFLFDSFPLFFLRSIINIRNFGATISKMTILMTYLALEGDLFIVELLNVRLVVNLEFNGFW